MTKCHPSQGGTWRAFRRCAKNLGGRVTMAGPALSAKAGASLHPRDAKVAHDVVGQRQRARSALSGGKFPCDARISPNGRGVLIGITARQTPRDWGDRLAPLSADDGAKPVLANGPPGWWMKGEPGGRSFERAHHPRGEMLRPICRRESAPPREGDAVRFVAGLHPTGDATPRE